MSEPAKLIATDNGALAAAEPGEYADAQLLDHPPSKSAAESASNGAPATNGSSLRKKHAPSLEQQLESCSRGGDWSTALQLMAQTRESASGPPSLACYRLTLQLLRTARQWQSASALVAQASTDGVALDAASYDAAIGALSGAPRAWQSALALQGQMEDAGVAPTPRVCTTLTEVMAECGQYQQAVELLDSFTSRGGRPEAAAYAAAARACERAGSWLTALAVVRSALGVSGADPDEPPPPPPKSPRGAAASAGIAGGGWREGVSAAVIAPAVRALAEAAQFDDAMSLLPWIEATLATAVGPAGAAKGGGKGGKAAATAPAARRRRRRRRAAAAAETEAHAPYAASIAPHAASATPPPRRPPRGALTRVASRPSRSPSTAIRRAAAVPRRCSGIGTWGWAVPRSTTRANGRSTSTRPTYAVSSVSTTTTRPTTPAPPQPPRRAATSHGARWRTRCCTVTRRRV